MRKTCELLSTLAEVLKIFDFELFSVYNMVVLVEDKMETDEIKQKKRKSFLLDESLEHGKRVKFQSFPKATSKLSVSAAAATLSQDEDVEKRNLLHLFTFVYIF